MNSSEISAKNRKQLKKQLRYQLDQFAKITQWTDLGNWLQKTAKFLEQYPTDNIPYSKELALNLCKCLSEQLPIGIHKTTLNIYNIIFEQLKQEKSLLAARLPIYSFGLFPFFPKSSIQVKPDIIQLFNNYFIPLQLDLIPLLSGLLSCLLPGLEEQDGTIQSLLNCLFKDINKRVGDKHFMATLWFILIKNSKNRNSALKVLQMKFSTNYVEFSENDFQQYAQDPTKAAIVSEILETNGKPLGLFVEPQIVISAICNCIHDQDISVCKKSLDFMIQNQVMFTEGFFKDMHWDQICVSLLKLIRQNDLSLIKLENFEEFQIKEENNSILQQLIHSFKKILLEEDLLVNDFSLPFEVLQTLQENIPPLFEYFIKYISMNIVQYMYKKHQKITEKEQDNFQKTIEKFLKNNKNLIEEFFNDLFGELEEVKLELSFDMSQFLKNHLILKITELPVLQTKKLFQLISFNQQKIDHQITQQNFKQEMISDFFDFYGDAIDFLCQIVESKPDILEEELLQNLSTAQDQFSFLLNQLLQQGQEILIEQNLNKHFQILFQMEKMKESKKHIWYEDFSNLPLWYAFLLDYCFLQYEFVYFQSIKFLLSLFEEKEKSRPIAALIDFIFYNKKNYQQEQICHKFLIKLMEMVEVTDFQQEAMELIEKLIEIDKEFVQQYILDQLSIRSAEQFRKVSQLWKATGGHSENFNFVLQKTVFKMISFIQIDDTDTLMRSYFKDWLIQTNNNFSLILYIVIDKLDSYTKWNILKNDIQYRRKFDCTEFRETLSSLEVILDHGKDNFLHYMIMEKLPEEFIKRNDRLQESFVNTSLIRKKPTETYSYLMFIVRLLFRYLKGSPSEEVIQMENLQTHIIDFLRLKVDILVFLQKIFSSLNESVTQDFAIILLPICIQELQLQIKNSQTNLQLEYLNLISFFIFQTKLLKNSQQIEDAKKLIEDQQFLDTILLGLSEEPTFMVKEYCQFLVGFYDILGQNFKHPKLTQFVKKIIEHFTQLIEEKCCQITTIRQQEQSKEKIRRLVKGLQYCLTYFFNVQEIQERVNSRSLERAFISVFTLGIIGQKEEVRKKIDYITDPQTVSNMLTQFEIIFFKLINAWSQIKKLHQTDIFCPFEKGAKLVNEGQETYGVSKYLLDVFVNLYARFPIRTMEAFLNNWMSHLEDLKIKDVFDEQKIFFNIKIVEILLQIKPNPLDFLQKFQQLKPVLNLSLLSRYSSKKTYELVISKDTDYEVGVLSFLYVYLKYNSFEPGLSSEFYSNLLIILKGFDASKTPLTLLWIVDIIQLCLEKVFFDHCNLKMKKEWRPFLRTLFTKIFQNITQRINLIYSDDRETCKTSLPFNPTFYKFLSTKTETINKKSCSSEWDFIVGVQNFNENYMHVLRYRTICLLTLQENGVSILNKFFCSQGQDVFNTFKIRTFFEIIFDIFQKEGNENVIQEHSSQLLFIFGQANKTFYKEYKKEFLEIFNRDSFFKVQMDILKIWSNIIDKFLEQTSFDIFSEQLENINFKSLFGGKDILNKKRIKGFQRICFVVFSGQQEKYMDEVKLKLLLEKIRDVLAEKEVHPNLHTLIFFAIRIFLLRLKKETLDRHFKFLWRWIVFLIYRILQKKDEKDQVDGQVIIAALKLLELVSQMDIEEFNLHKWAFLFENFGVSLQQSQEEKKPDSFFIRPLLSNHLPKTEEITYKFTEQIVCSQIDNKIIFDKNQMAPEELQNKISEFLKKVIRLAPSNEKLDLNQMEELIRGDFIEFAEYANISKQLISFTFLFF